MAYATRRSYAGAAPSCTLTNTIASGDTSASLTGDTTNWPSTSNGPFYMVIDPGLANEEKVLVTTRSTGSLSSITRGVDGTVASAHNAGATCYPVFTSVDADQANKVASVLTTKGDLMVTDGSALNRLAVGTNDYTVLADSSATNGVKWGQVPAAGIATDAVTTAKILDANVTAAKLATNAVTTAKIADGAVTAAKLDSAAAIQPTIVDAKGDLIVGSGADAVARLAVGTSGYFLKADSGATNGLSWAAVAQAVSAINLDYVATDQTTSSTSYADLSTSGPSVTLTTGTSAIVLFGCYYGDTDNLGNDGYMSVAVSGASTVSASDTWAAIGNQGLNNVHIVNGYKFTGLTAGSNTFTAKYKKANGTSTAQFKNRFLLVIAI